MLTFRLLKAILARFSAKPPTATSHFASAPSSMVGDNAGILISIAIIYGFDTSRASVNGSKMSVKSSLGSGSGLV